MRPSCFQEAELFIWAGLSPDPSCQPLVVETKLTFSVAVVLIALFIKQAPTRRLCVAASSPPELAALMPVEVLQEPRGAEALSPAQEPWRPPEPMGVEPETGPEPRSI